MHELTPSQSIDTLPAELLSTVFLHLRQVRRYRQLLPFQVTISHVCRHWRQVAISTPQLWSSITLFSKRSLPCLEEWLRRSGAAPLDVRLDLYDAEYREKLDITWITETLTRIASCAHRFQSLFVFTYREVNTYHVLQLFEHVEAPLLERLRIHIGRREHLRELRPFSLPGGGFSLPTIFSGGLPRLAFAELESVKCIPPLTTVTTLHLNVVGTALSFSRLVEILQMPHDLVSFSLRGYIEEGGWPVQRDRPHIRLNNLRNLEVSARGATGVFFILFIGIPNLESLRWHADSDNYHQLLDSAQYQPNTVKFPALKYLTLVGQPLTPHHLEILKRIFPTPTHVLYSHPLTPLRSPRHLSLLCDSSAWENLQVLALQRLSSPLGSRLARELWQELLPARPNIRRIVVDKEFMAYASSGAPVLRSSVELEELNSQTFPEYWFASRLDRQSDGL